MIVETTCFLINKAVAELLGTDSAGEIEAKCAIDFLNVECIRETVTDGADDEISDARCMIIFKSGESLLVQMPYRIALGYLKESRK